MNHTSQTAIVFQKILGVISSLFFVTVPVVVVFGVIWNFYGLVLYINSPSIQDWLFSWSVVIILYYHTIIIVGIVLGGIGIICYYYSLKKFWRDRNNRGKKGAGVGASVRNKNYSSLDYQLETGWAGRTEVEVGNYDKLSETEGDGQPYFSWKRIMGGWNKRVDAVRKPGNRRFSSSEGTEFLN
jgi:hypothetical protein